MDLHDVLRRAVLDPASLLADPPGQHLEAAAGRTIYFAGDPSDQVYLLLEGQVCCTLGDESPRPVLFLQAPALFGDGAVLAQSVARENVVALTPTRLVAVAATEFLSAYGKQPELTLLLARDLAERNSQSLATLELQLLALPERILALLLTLYPDDGDIELLAADFASLTGATTKSVSKAIAKLKAESLIEETSDRRVVLNRELAAQRHLPELPGLYHQLALTR